MDIFHDRDDYAFLIARLREAFFPVFAPNAHGHHAQRRSNRKVLPPGAFSLLAYVLMPNHYHLLVRQESDMPISSLMMNVFTGYSKYFNKKHDRVGSLFQDQFKAVRIETDEQLRWISAYIHSNPSVARLVSRDEEYAFSSFQDYIGVRNGTLCQTSLVLESFPSRTMYADFVREAADVISQRKDIEHILLD